MRLVMAQAPVGDCFYDEDPSVRELESNVARLFGHDSALFVPSGTMSNQIAVQLHCNRGEALLSASDLHVLRAESGAIAALAGVQPAAVPVEDEFLPEIEKLEESFVPKNSIVSAPTRLLVAENTHLFSGGRIHPMKHLQQLAAWCNEKGIAFHLDGARIWHAHVETQIPLSAYGKLFSTISVCFSKGLGAPAGSCLIGPESLIQKGKVLRKRMGGTMRQCGILAAAASYALTHHLQHLKEDHINAAKFAHWLQAVFPEARIPRPETNIVLMKFEQNSLHLLQEIEAQYGIKMSALNPKTLRAVCYRDISAQAIDELTAHSSAP
jgi:threonine aldolase